MALDDLTKAFRSGSIGRRAFVRGMVGLGMTVTAANLLADEAEAAPKKKKKIRRDDVYGLLVVKIARKIVNSPVVVPRTKKPIANPKKRLSRS